MAEKSGNRWLIAIMGTVLQITLGTIYAWSFFQNPLIDRSKEIAGVTAISKNLETARQDSILTLETFKSAEVALKDALSLNVSSTTNLETVKADAGKKPTKAKLEMITAAEAQLSASETVITEANAKKASAENAVKAAEETIKSVKDELKAAKGNVWTQSQVQWILSLAICFLGLSAMLGGFILPKFGPRKLAMSGAILYGLGWIIGGIALGMDKPNLSIIYLGLGVIGGIGLGLGYVTPVATAAKWFPDKKGFITGMVVMGFGLGALFMSKIIGPILFSVFSDGQDPITKKYIDTDYQMVFIIIGIVLGGLGLFAAKFFKNPPVGFVPEGYTPPAPTTSSNAQSNLTVKQSILSGPFWKIWFFFFCNITAGIMFIGFQSPLIQDLMKNINPKVDAETLRDAGAWLIAISSLFNGVGRFFWGGLSDKIGRAQAFRLILGSQIIVFVLLTQVSNPWLFGALVCYILLCYGGGFGTAPSFVTTVFGPKNMAIVYGTLLTAWSTAGIVGTQIAAYYKDSNPVTAPNYTFLTGAAFLLAGLIVAFMTNNKEYSKN